MEKFTEDRTVKATPAMTPALSHRLAGLIARGKKGDLFDAPETLAVLFELAARMLADGAAADALELAAWYAEEAALDGSATPVDEDDNLDATALAPAPAGRGKAVRP